MTFRSQITRRINRIVGNNLKRLGYEIVRCDRWPTGNLNLLELAFYTLKDRKRPPYRIFEVGAFDGVHNDPLSQILDDPDVLAILVEPQEGPFEKLSERFAGSDRIHLKNLAIGTETGYAKLYIPALSDAVPTASLLPAHSEKFGLRNVKQVDVHLTTCCELLSEYGWESIDILQIDAEGMDFEIVKSVFAAKIYPMVINIETFHLCNDDRKQYYSMLNNVGYKFQDWGFDTIAVRKIF